MRVRSSSTILKLLAPLGIAFTFSCMLFLFTMQTPAMAQTAHALPTTYYPQQNAVLKTPPPYVTIQFNEQLNPDVSRIVVVNPSNQEVDNHDSRIGGDDLSMTVTLPLLPAGTYVVAWRTHSATDGHIAAGSYLFHVENAAGIVPALTGSLPSGNFPGEAGNAPTNGLDTFTFLEAIARWVTTVALAMFLGIVFWWLIVMPRQSLDISRLRGDFTTTMLQSADIALESIAAAAFAELLFQAMSLDNSVRGATNVSLIEGILLQSHYGQFLLSRFILAIVGIIVIWIPRWQHTGTLRIRQIIVSLFSLVLTLAFLYSGHGGASIVWWGPPVDLLHILAMGVWLGGIFTLAACVFPVLRGRSQNEVVGYLVVNLPAFSLAALVGAILLAVTGPLNATVRMQSISQMWTTTYGQVLMLKILLYFVMVAISYYHVFRLRPRLAAKYAMGMPSAGSRLTVINWLEDRMHAFERWQSPADLTPQIAGSAASIALSKATDAEPLAQLIQRLIRIEVGCGVVILLCSALLSPLSQTLAPSFVASSTFGATGGNQTFTQAADTLQVTLTISPGRFGANQVTVVIKNPDGTFATDGTVIITANMVEMDMGTNTFNLTASGQPGTYQGSVDLSMAGHWNLETIIRTKQDPSHLHRTTFTVAASF